VLHTILGRALYEKKRYDEAIDHYRHALRADPNLAAAHVNLGPVLRVKEQRAEAVDHVQQAHRIERESARCSTGLA
jgi:tetratricopeptide (TPR) repeat protein